MIASLLGLKQGALSPPRLHLSLLSLSFSLPCLKKGGLSHNSQLHLAPLWLDMAMLCHACFIHLHLSNALSLLFFLSLSLSDLSWSHSDSMFCPHSTLTPTHLHISLHSGPSENVCVCAYVFVMELPLLQMWHFNLRKCFYLLDCFLFLIKGKRQWL